MKLAVSACLLGEQIRFDEERIKKVDFCAKEGTGLAHGYYYGKLTSKPIRKCGFNS